MLDSPSLFNQLLSVTDFNSLSQACFSFWSSTESLTPGLEVDALLLCGYSGEQIILWQKELALLASFPSACSGIPESLIEQTSENNQVPPNNSKPQ